MEKGRHAQYGAATGIIAVILTVVGFSIFSADIPNNDEAAQQWQTFFIDHQDRVQTGMIIVAVAVLFFIWFLGSLRDAIASMEGGGARLASIAHGGGLVAAASLVAGISGFVTASFHPQGLDPNLTRAFADFGALTAAPGGAGLAAMFGATAVAGYRRAVLPAPVAGISALAAICQLLAILTVATDHGAFAPDGVLGLIVPIATFAIATLAISGALVSRAGQTQA
jgi:hypothetical protein